MKFEFTFLSVGSLPLVRATVGTVIEDSMQGTRIVLNGSDDDSKFTTFIITELPRMGKLFRVTGEPIQTPFFSFQERASL